MDLPLIAHVGGGTLALVSAAVALSLRKGSKLHKRAGYTFVGAMLIMALPGGVISFVAGKPFDVLSSLLTLYMVATGAMAFRGATKVAFSGFMVLAAVCLTGYLAVELFAMATDVRATDAPAGAGFVFATVLALALLGDYRLARYRYAPRQAMVRHLWRMNFGLLIATGSFFGARPHLFPDWMQTSGLLLLLALAPLLIAAFWGLRVRLRMATRA